MISLTVINIVFVPLALLNFGEIGRSPNCLCQEQFNEEDLQDSFDQVEYSIRNVEPGLHILHARAGEDADGDGEARVHDDKEGAQLEEEPVQQGWFRIVLVHEALGAQQAVDESTDAKDVGDGVDAFCNILVHTVVLGTDAEEDCQGSYVEEENEESPQESPQAVGPIHFLHGLPTQSNVDDILQEILPT